MHVLFTVAIRTANPAFRCRCFQRFCHQPRTTLCAVRCHAAVPARFVSLVTHWQPAAASVTIIEGREVLRVELAVQKCGCTFLRRWSILCYRSVRCCDMCGTRRRKEQNMPPLRSSERTGRNDTPSNASALVAMAQVLTGLLISTPLVAGDGWCARKNGAKIGSYG